eukprot:gene15120-21177_t
MPDWARLSVVDYHGQQLAELVMVIITVVFAITSFVLGYAQADWWLMVKINCIGLPINCLALSPWPVGCLRKMSDFDLRMVPAWSTQPLHEKYSSDPVAPVASHGGATEVVNRVGSASS